MLLSSAAFRWFRTAADVARRLCFISRGFRRTFPRMSRCWPGLVTVSVLVCADSQQHVRELVECLVCGTCVCQSQLTHHARHEPGETCTATYVHSLAQSHTLVRYTQSIYYTIRRTNYRLQFCSVSQKHTTVHSFITLTCVMLAIFKILSLSYLPWYLQQNLLPYFLPHLECVTAILRNFGLKFNHF